MTIEELAQISSVRLAKWGETIVKEHGTPMLTIGVGHDHNAGNIILCMPEDLSDSQALLLLRGVIRALQGRCAAQN